MKTSFQRTMFFLTPALLIGLGNYQALRAQETPPDEFVLRVGQDQRRLDGIVRSINAERGSFSLEASSISYPSGRPNPFDTPRSVLVTTNSDTYLHERGNKDNIEFADIRVGDSAVIIATFSTTEQSWSAAEIAVWTKQENGRYILAGKRAAFPTPAGLVASWKWENSTTDTSGKYMGSQQHGTAFTRGLIGQALRFDGQDDRLTIADAPAFALTRSLSVEGWVFIAPPLSYKYALILSRTAKTGPEPYTLYLKPDGTVTFRLMNGKKFVLLNAPIPGQKWVHVAATLDDATGNLRLYINGVLGAEAQTEVRPGDNVSGQEGAALGIGNYPSRSGFRATYTFRGMIDDMALYNRALTAEEVQGIYKAGAAGKTAPLPPSPPSTP